MSLRGLIVPVMVTLIVLCWVVPSYDAYVFTILSKTLPQGSSYIETNVTSSELSASATSLSITSDIQAIINTSMTTDLTLNVKGTGLFAIVSMDPNSLESYCVIHALDSKSTTVEQNGLACTIAPSISSARIQAEPSKVMCGGLNPCKQSVVPKLDIDAATPNNNNNGNGAQTTQDDNMGASSTTIIIAAVGGTVGLVVLVVLIGMVCHSRRKRHYEKMQQEAAQQAAASSPTSSTMWATPPAVMAASTSTESRERGASAHVRTQTELNYAVNPMQYNVAVDMHESAVQLAPPTHRYQY